MLELLPFKLKINININIMSKNIPEAQDNQKFILHFDDADLLSKQLGDFIHIIESARNLRYIEDLRNKMIEALTEIDGSERKEINDLLNQSGIFEKIADKQTALRQEIERRRDTNFKKHGHYHKRRRALKLVPHRATIEHKTPEGAPLTLCCGDARVEAVQWRKIINERSEKGNQVEREKAFIQITAISGGEIPKVRVGNVYDTEFLPILLRFAYYPDAKRKYEAEQAEKEAAKLQERRALSAANKGKKGGKQKNKEDKAA